MSTTIGYGDGDVCNRSGCVGVIDVQPSENCSCHLSAPCYSCTAPRNFCPACDWEEKYDPAEEEAPTHNYSYAFPKQRTLTDLDPTRLDWISSSHSSCSMIKEGVYPKDMPLEEVRKAVDGTFGGRFDYVRDGKFKFIAYTD